MRYMFAVAAVLAALSSAAPLNADEPITVSVYPTVAVARGTARVRIFVERNDQNRWLNWEVDGPEYYRSSQAQLDGAEAPRSWFYEIKDLPEGSYAIRATVRRSNNSEAVARTSITVMAGSMR